MVGEPLRRGLPRLAGAEPWPPSGSTAAFEVVAPATSAPAAPAPPPEQSVSTPAVSTPAVSTPASGSRRTGLPRPGQTAIPEPAGAAPAIAHAPASDAAPTGRRSGLPRPGQAAPGAPAAAVAAAAPVALAEPPTPDTPAPAAPTASGVPAESAGAPARSRYRVIGWGVAGAVAIVAIAVLLSRWFLLGTHAGRQFLEAYPGTTPLPGWVPTGIPSWLGWQHFLSAFFIVLVIRTGWIVRTTARPSASWSRRHPKPSGRKISIELWAHLSLDLLWLANGVVFVVLIFCTGQWARIVPTSWGVVPNAVSAGLQYLSLNWPSEDGWVNYNSLQLLAYFATVFLAAPLAAITGFRMSPLWPARNERLSRAYPVELARAIHFPVMLYFVLFVVVHVGLVLSTGALRNLNHMYGAQDAVNWWGFGVFVVSLAAMVGGWLLIRPTVMQQAGALFGKVGR